MWVRTSTTSYGSFILDMDRSPGFGSTATDYVALLRLGFPSAPQLYCLTSPVTVTRRTVLQKVRGSTAAYADRCSTACKHRVSGSLSLPSRGPFHLSFTVLCAIGHQVVFSLGGWSPLLPAGFPVSRGTLDTAMSDRISPTGLSPSLAGFPKTVRLYSPNQLCSPQPRNACIAVWALPISLAATLGIDVSFSSSPYLDVSVQAVPLHTLCVGVWMTRVFLAGFPHSDIRGSLAICAFPRLFAACHVLHRLLVPRHPPCALIA